MRKFFYRAGAVFLLLMVGLLLAMVGQHSDVLFYGGGAIMCSAILLGLAFMYESLEPDERLGMRIGMYAAVGVFAFFVLLELNVNLGFLLMMTILVAPGMILGSIDLLCCYFAQRTAAGLSQGVNLSQGSLTQSLLDTPAPAPGAVPAPAPAPANQAGATSNLFRQSADQRETSVSIIELTPQQPKA